MGFDQFHGGEGNDSISDSAGGDTIAGETVSYANSDAGIAIPLGNNAGNAGGHALGDLLTGNSGVNTIEGGAGG